MRVEHLRMPRSLVLRGAGGCGSIPNYTGLASGMRLENCVRRRRRRTRQAASPGPREGQLLRQGRKTPLEKPSLTAMSLPKLKWAGPAAHGITEEPEMRVCE